MLEAVPTGPGAHGPGSPADGPRPSGVRRPGLRGGREGRWRGRASRRGGGDAGRGAGAGGSATDERPVLRPDRRARRLGRSRIRRSVRPVPQGDLSGRRTRWRVAAATEKSTGRRGLGPPVGRDERRGDRRRPRRRPRRPWRRRAGVVARSGLRTRCATGGEGRVPWLLRGAGRPTAGQAARGRHGGHRAADAGSGAAGSPSRRPAAGPSWLYGGRRGWSRPGWDRTGRGDE